MPSDIIHLEGEPARALAPLLLQAFEGAQAMSETAEQLRAAYTANTEATARLAEAFEQFRTQQQTRLDEALARVETEVAARVQAEADRDAIRAVIEEARTAIEADTARENEMLAALTGSATQPVPETPAETPAEPTPEPTPEPPVDTAPVETPVEPAPVVDVPVTDPATATDPAATPGDATPATNGIGQTFNADGTPVA